MKKKKTKSEKRTFFLTHFSANKLCQREREREVEKREVYLVGFGMLRVNWCEEKYTEKLL
jgi:hypothetical protein